MQKIIKPLLLASRKGLLSLCYLLIIIQKDDYKYNGLVLNHLAPLPDNRAIEQLYMEELNAFKGPIHLANDGDVFIVDGKN